MKLSLFGAAYISAGILLCSALMFGGASQGNAISLGVTELVALPALAFGVRLTLQNLKTTRALPLCILIGIILIPLLQLIPLPPEIWTRLPGRQSVVAIFHVIKSPLPMAPISLTPEATTHCAFALLPPIALFLVVSNLDIGQRRQLLFIVFVVALLSIGIGIAQIVGGPTSRFYFYKDTNFDSSVGFFANRDHFAALLACAIPLSAGALLTVGPSQSRLAYWAPRTLLLAIPVFLAGIAVTASRAGIVLGFIAVTTTVLASASGRRRAMGLTLGLAFAAAALILFAGMTNHLPGIARFMGSEADLRFRSARFILRAAKQYWPIGAGVGSFIPIYQTVQPTSLVDTTILNHAHDEFLEALLESGAAACLIVAFFAAWWIPSALSAWREPSRLGDSVFAKVGAAVVGMVLVHATVDFPLRNVALASIFALACALLTPPRPIPSRSPPQPPGKAPLARRDQERHGSA